MKVKRKEGKNLDKAEFKVEIIERTAKINFSQMLGLVGLRDDNLGD